MKNLRVFNCRHNHIKGDLKNVFSIIIEGSNLTALDLKGNDLTLEAGKEILAAIKNTYLLESCTLKNNFKIIHALIEDVHLECIKNLQF
jgi:Ran GTPase-activating protein (RanGAP) involved in mRNA processing and transport